ncbi:MAG: ABC transporter permease [Bacteroidia bacterium]|nr:ABC transporter permease [Bacteroidia bacterium]MCX7652608.1 ABC transporter permease [Bacteroidia bacterium]MDW8417039.1 ABC transporter permease [Bacteroidia bacterium]
MFAEAFRQTLRNIQAHRRRSILTLLTIAVGIFSVASVRVFTYSMERSIVGRFERLGTSTVYVHHFPWRFSDENWQDYFRRPRIGLVDYEAVRSSLGAEAWIALRYDRPSEKVSFRSVSEETRVVGVTEDFHVTFPLEVKYGRFFSQEELRHGAAVAVLGSRLSRALTGGENSIGLEVQYAGRSFRIIGVLRSQGSFGGDFDRAMIIPFQALYRYRGLQRYQGDRTLLVRAKNPEALPIDLLEMRVRGVMRRARHLPPRTPDNFAINRQDALLDQVYKITGYVETIGMFIAGFALIVGGFGVANILYIAVRERRSEIGIQRAMGAPRHFILVLFLIEGILLTLAGGAIGLFLTGALTLGLSGWAAGEGIILAVAPKDLVWTILVTIGVGLLAAFSPAWSAARLHPIQAIRSGY